MTISVFVYYKRNKTLIQTRDLSRKNTNILILAFLTAFGILIFGNYRMTELYYGHVIGGWICFGFGSILALQLVFHYFRDAQGGG